jgi:cardiolipin synthase (CMP-forming)
MTLANKITLLRIFLIPVFIVLLLQGHHPWPAIIFTFTIVTDALDGFIARWKKQKTALGSFLDPLADKLLMVSSFLTLAYLKVIPLWIFVVTMSRDLIIVLGWVLMYFIMHTTEIKPRLLGKITAIVQMLTTWFILVGVQDAWKERLLLLTVLVTCLSGVDYMIAGSKKMGKNS